MRKVQIDSCENMLAVLFRGDVRHKVFLYNGESQTWFEELDLSQIMPNCYAVDITLGVNLLAVSVIVPIVGPEECKTLCWHLDTSQPEDTLPQFLGTLDFPNMRVVKILMNEKWIGVWRLLDKEIVILEKEKLFDQNQIAEEAQRVDPELPQSPWRLMILNDLDFYRATYVSLEPGSSNHLAVKALSPCTSRFRILNLATCEIVCQISMDIMDLHPVSWWGGNILFLKMLQRRRFDTEQEVQVMVFDPSGSKIPRSLEQLEEEALWLLPGPRFKYSGATKLSFRLDLSQVDYFGILLVEHPTLFIAST
jgi:hypothetical protein